MQNYMKTILSGIQTWVKGKIKQSTADWNQNDSSADSFVKNRTHYEEKVENILVDNLTFEQFESGEYPKCNFVPDRIYSVIWNGTTYDNLKCYYDGEFNIIADESLGCPFYIGDDGGNGLYIEGERDEDGDIPFIVSIIEHYIVIHQLDPKFIPEDAISVQPDWNQNDPNAKDYIKNRIGYIKISDTPYISEQTITEYHDFNDVYYSYLPTDSFEFVEGRVYVVYWDGASYSVTGQYYEDYSSYWYLGNSSLHQYMTTTEDNGMPFLIIKEHEPEYGTYWQVWTEDNNPHTFSVYENEIHKIDVALLPNTKPLIINNVYYDGLTSANVITGAMRGIGIASAVLNFNDVDDNDKSRASGDYSHAEGNSTIASGHYSHAAGNFTQALAENEYIIGRYNIPAEIKPVLMNTAFSTKNKTTPIVYANSYTYDPVTCKFTFESPITGVWSDIKNKKAYFTTDTVNVEYDSINYKTSETYTVPSLSNYYRYDYEKYMIKPEPKYAFIIGNGTGDSVHSNAHTLDWDGNAWYSGDVYVGSTSGTNKDEGSVKLATVDELAAALEGVSGFVAQADEPEDKSVLWLDIDDDTDDSGSGSGSGVNLSNYYTKSEIDAIMGSYITDIDPLLGGDA